MFTIESTIHIAAPLPQVHAAVTTEEALAPNDLASEAVIAGA